MLVEYSPRKIGVLKREIWNYWRTGRVIEKFLSVKRLDGFVLCIQGWRKTSSSKFLATKKRLRVVKNGVFRPCLAAGRLVTSLQERQQH